MLYRNFNSVQLVSKPVVSLRNENIYFFSTSVELETDNVCLSVCLCVRHKTLGHDKILLRHQIR